MVNASAEGHMAGSATGFVGERFAMAVSEPHLWSVEDPFLYDLDVVLLGGENSNGDMVSIVCMQCWYACMQTRVTIPQRCYRHNAP